MRLVRGFAFLFLKFLSFFGLFCQPMLADKHDTSAQQRNELINVWRENAGMLYEGKQPYSIIEDRGHLSITLPTTKNEYIFSEHGAGVKPIVLVGTADQILERIDFEAKRKTQVRSSIPEQQAIYMGIAKYSPGKRFVARYPLNDFAKQLLMGMMDLGLPTSEITDVVTNLATLAMTSYELRDGRSPRKQKQSKAFADQLLCLKLSYLPENGMTEIGKGVVSFDYIEDKFRAALASAATDIKASKKK